MKKLITVLFLMWVVEINLYSQQNYGDYRVSYNVFFENFDDNQNNWNISDNSEIKQQIRDGKYLFQSKCEESKVTWKTINFDSERDFEIETLISYYSGTQNNSYGLIWGKSDINNDEYSYFFAATGFYRIDKLVDNVFQPYTDWIESDLVNKTGYNKLTVRKIGPMVYYFMNEAYVFEHVAPKFYGYQFGFHVTNNAAILIDYLSISYLETN